jgi:hypothetical protein
VDVEAICKRLAKEGKTPPVHNSAQWKRLIAWLEKQHGRSICGAKVKSSGWPCEVGPKPNGRCHVHGGASLPPGPLHPRYESGRYSQALNGHSIQELYERARTDPHLLALTEEIALLVAKQQETLRSLSTGESEQGWEAALHQCRQLRDAVERGADGETASALDIMQAILEGGLGDRQVWQEYSMRAEQIRRLVDTERKYQEGLRLYLPLDRANAIMGVWLDCIRRVVPQEYIGLLHEEFRKARMQEMPTIGSTGRDVTAVARRRGA